MSEQRRYFDDEIANYVIICVIDTIGELTLRILKRVCGLALLINGSWNKQHRWQIYFQNYNGTVSPYEFLNRWIITALLTMICFLYSRIYTEPVSFDNGLRTQINPIFSFTDSRNNSESSKTTKQTFCNDCWKSKCWWQ